MFRRLVFRAVSYGLAARQVRALRCVEWRDKLVTVQ